MRVHLAITPFNFLGEDDDEVGEFARLDAPLGATLHELAEEICNALGWRSQGRSFELELYPSGLLGVGDGAEVGSGKIGGHWCLGDGDDEYNFFGPFSSFHRIGGHSSSSKPALWAFGPTGWARSKRQSLADLYRFLRVKSLLLFVFAGHYVAARVLRIGEVDRFGASFIQRTSLTARPDFQPPLSDGEEEEEEED